MSLSQRLRPCDFRAIFRWAGEVAELGFDARQWRTHALRGLIELVGGHVALSADLADALPGHTPRPIDPIDVGWTDQSVRDVYHQYYRESAATDPGAIALIAHHRETHFLTVCRSQLVDDADWFSAYQVSELRRFGNVNDFVSSTVAWDGGWMQGFIVYRQWRDKSFGLRERRIMRLCHLELLRLYRDCAVQRIDGAAELPPRIAQTLHFLLEGQSLKETADRLHLSVHTVNDYAKVIYRRLDVQSRGQLLKKCLARTPRRTLALPHDMPVPPWPLRAN